MGGGGIGWSGWGRVKEFGMGRGRMGSGHHVGGNNTNLQPGCFILILKLEYPFYAPPQKVARVLLYTVRNFECPSIIHAPSRTLILFTKLLTNVKHYDTPCRTHEW